MVVKPETADQLVVSKFNTQPAGYAVRWHACCLQGRRRPSLSPLNSPGMQWVQERHHAAGNAHCPRNHNHVAEYHVRRICASDAYTQRRGAGAVQPRWIIAPGSMIGVTGDQPMSSTSIQVPLLGLNRNSHVKTFCRNCARSKTL